jgi:carbonic anhydrase/acetyltransferase-like protein (isoleucine patch superfamily)
MPVILPVEGKSPRFGHSCFLAPNATVVGEVEIGDHCSIWFNAVVRGDVGSIHIGEKVNIQDGVVIHATYQKTKVRIGNDVSIGHNAIIHGCTIEDRVLIGMGAIVMDNAVVGRNSIIAAGAVVLEGTRIESGTIYGGIPARKIKDVPPELISGQIERIANHYLVYAGWFEGANTAPNK